MNKSRIIDLILDLKNNCLRKEDSIKEEFGILPAEYNGILALGNNENLTCSAMAERMNLSYSRGSRVVDKLVKNGYMKYLNCENDRRVVFVKLTSKGKLVKNKIEFMLNECDNEINKKLSDNEIRSFKKSVYKIRNILTLNN